MKGPVGRSETIYELFGREKLDPAADEIVAVAIISEKTMNVVDVDRALSDPSALGPMDDAEQARFLAGKIVPQYQPRFIPARARLTPGTKYVGREFKPGESLDGRYVNRRLAEMLADVLDDEELEGCSALALIGNSPALGETRFAVVARAPAAGVSPRDLYTKPIFGGIVGTYETYDAPDIETARTYLAGKAVTERFYYVEIYTPEGGIGKDAEGTYEFDTE